MAGGIDWFRWHHGSVTDPKFQLVSRKAAARFGDVVTVWAYVLEAASASDERGQVGAIDAEAVDCMLGADEGTTARILDAMQARGLIDGGAVASWDKRQPKRERPEDNSAARTRSYRDRQAGSSDATQSYVTPSDATQRQETPRGEESREEQIQAPPASRVPPADAGSKPRALKRCPESFAPSDDMRQWAMVEAPRADFSRELAKFRDYTFKTAHSDWTAAFRNWLRKASDDAAKRPQSFMAEKKDEMAKWFKGTSLDTSTQQDYIDADPLTLR